MRFTYTQKNITTPLMGLGAFLMLFSCGSYQYVGYDNDGIYGSSSEQVVVEVEEASNSRANSEYYTNYFSDTVQNLDAIEDESEIFTDVDSYSSGAVVEQEEIPGNYGGWGQVNDQVIVNVYDNGWNNWGWGWNDPWLWNGGFGGGFNNWGFNRWNRWGGFGLGFGWGWNDPWLWNGGFGGGFNNWGWNNRFYRNDLAFNRGRRGAIYGRNSALNSRSIARLDRRTINRGTVNRRGNSIGRRVRTNDGNSTRVRRNSNGTITRRNGSTGVRRGVSTRNSRINRSSTTTRRSSRGTVRRSSGSTRSSGTVRRSSGSRSSSGSIRRSSGSSRSSGGRSSGGSRGGGRRG